MSIGLNKNDNIMGIDIGTSKIRVYVKNKGVVYNEACCCAVKSADNKSFSFGNSAKALEGKVTKDVFVVDIVKDSRIAYREKAKELLSIIISGFKGLTYLGPKVLCTVTADLSDVDKRALKEILLESGAGTVKFVNSALACAIGCGVNPKQTKGVLFADIGAGSTTSAIITSGAVASESTVNYGGIHMTQAIMDYISKKCGIRTGKEEAEKIKIKAATSSVYTIGKNMHNLLPGIIEIYREEIVLATESIMYYITESIRETLRKAPPELCADIYDGGINICGGASLMTGLDAYMAKSLNLPVHTQRKSEVCAIEGLGKMIESNMYEIL